MKMTIAVAAVLSAASYSAARAQWNGYQQRTKLGAIAVPSPPER